MTKKTERLIETIVRKSTNGICKLTRDEYGDGWNPLNCDLEYSGFVLGENWILSAATDDESMVLLQCFLHHNNDIAFELSCHFARLLSEKGFLVKAELEDLIASANWSSYDSPQFVLAGLPHIKDGAIKTIELLDTVPPDHRDGIFMACWYFMHPQVQEKLLHKFEEWILDDTWGTGDGEGAWLGRFLGKWISRETFPYNRLEKLIVWHFIHEHKFNC